MKLKTCYQYAQSGSYYQYFCLHFVFKSNTGMCKLFCRQLGIIRDKIFVFIHHVNLIWKWFDMWLIKMVSSGNDDHKMLWYTCIYVKQSKVMCLKMYEKYFQKVILYSRSIGGDRLLSESSHLRPPLMCLRVKGCGMLRHDKKNG